MEMVISRLANDSAKVDRWIDYSRSLISSNPESAIKAAEKGKSLAEKINYAPGMALAYKTIGIGHYMQAHYLEALENYEKALTIFTALNDKVGVANILSNEGAVYFNQSDDARALELYLKSLRVAETISDTLRMATALQNIGAVYFNKPASRDKALEFYLKALPLCEATGDQDAIGTVSVNLGEIYLAQGDLPVALSYFEKSLKAFEGSENIPYALNDMGKVYMQQGNYTKAISYHQQAYDISSRLQAKLDMVQSLIGMADTYREEKKLSEAIGTYMRASEIARQLSGVTYELKNAYAGLALSYGEKGDFKNAFHYQAQLTNIKDSLYNLDVDRKLSGLQFNFDLQKKQAQIDLLTKDKALQDLELRRQKLVRNALVVGLALGIIIVFIMYRDYRIKVWTNRILDSQKAEIESLLLNILPEEVAQELQMNGMAMPRYFENVSVLFSDFKSFTRHAESLDPQEVVSELNACFIAFDDIIEKYGLEKIKTIGDAYMCAGGIPSPDEKHAYKIVKASLEMQKFILRRNLKRELEGKAPWELRIGINIGPVVAGVVGRKKYAYDIWGSTVNVASRMESNGEPGKVNISAHAYEQVKDYFHCSYRGKIFAKNIGEIDMYFVESEMAEQAPQTSVQKSNLIT